MVNTVICILMLGIHSNIFCPDLRRCENQFKILNNAIL